VQREVRSSKTVSGRGGGSLSGTFSLATPLHILACVCSYSPMTVKTFRLSLSLSLVLRRYRCARIYSLFTCNIFVESTSILRSFQFSFLPFNVTDFLCEDIKSAIKIATWEMQHEKCRNFIISFFFFFSFWKMILLSDFRAPHLRPVFHSLHAHTRACTFEVCFNLV